ncbi:MAG: acetamidase/formamidase family protein [Candidatus Latescibacterota bacterium]|nr:acetamidase/formamidase family protein [Candidatus Latescibacterota bacterium]
MAHHNFVPQHYHTTIGWHDPVLEIDPGDSVATTMVDARGSDATGEQVTERGNPQTGPFFIRGAEPGDTLVVTLDDLRPNRDWGFTGGEVAPNVLDPGLRPVFAQDFDSSRWQIDFAANTVRLAEPELALSKLKLSLDPMVGCFGVAPERRQAISCATSSTHGGNMDYRGFRAGVKVYFPVFAPGALFHIGDGHAVQGDGEIVGTGVEISFDVRFTVDLVKGQRICWPRAEDDTYLMTVGNARPLDQCVQHATTEMLAWLENGFGIDARTAHMFLGQCVEYDVGNIYDPAYTMVCKVRWDQVEQLTTG